MAENQIKTPDLISVIVEGLQDIKARDITTIDMTAIESAGTPHFVICTGTSTSHVASIADKMQEFVRKAAGRKAANIDGERNCEWIIVDFGEAMVHIFLPEARERYALEQLWSDGVIKEIPDLY